MRIRLHLDPVAAPRQTQRDRWSPSEPVLRYRAFCDDLGVLANQAGWTLGDTLDVVFHIAMPPSWSNKKRLAMEGQPHQQKPDTDNLVKALCDCLTTDDSHVWSIRAEKRWAVEGAIEVEQARERETP